ncbi:MAG: Spx/MgsR family RNA polymerase-binding regulatory protein [Pseudomonadota bacterium]
MPPVLYGIRGCDTVRKARRWLDENGYSYEYMDLRDDDLVADTVRDWIERAGWERVINRRSTSWKALAPEARDGMDAKSALAAVMDQPTLVKRPVLVRDEMLEFGFSPQRYAALLG